jgi:5'-nucleotidase (lipoprotein e(P4) family)
MRLAAFALALIASVAAASPTTTVQAPVKTAPPAPMRIVLTPLPTAPAGNPPASMQWLYGSSEAAALSIQAYRGFRNYAAAIARHRPHNSVVLAEGSTLQDPRFVPCGRKPLAVVLDVDETALLNIGYEYDQAAQNRAYDPKRWSDWERTGVRSVRPVPGAVNALSTMRKAGIKVIFNSNRSLENVSYTAMALDAAGLGPARHLDTLFVTGDAPGGSAKDARRALIASRYCVVAMTGDQLGDFSDLFNAKDLSIFGRRELTMAGKVAQMWGNGWFVLPNPVYGTGVKGNFDDVFPTDTRWADPAGGQ